MRRHGGGDGIVRKNPTKIRWNVKGFHTPSCTTTTGSDLCGVLHSYSALGCLECAAYVASDNLPSLRAHLPCAKTRHPIDENRRAYRPARPDSVVGE